MPSSSIVFDPELNERKLDKEVSQIDDQLSSVGEDVPVSFDEEQLDSLGDGGLAVGRAVNHALVVHAVGGYADRHRRRSGGVSQRHRVPDRHGRLRPGTPRGT